MPLPIVKALFIGVDIYPPAILRAKVIKCFFYLFILVFFSRGVVLWAGLGWFSKVVVSKPSFCKVFTSKRLHTNLRAMFGVVHLDQEIQVGVVFESKIDVVHSCGARPLVVSVGL